MNLLSCYRLYWWNDILFHTILTTAFPLFIIIGFLVHASLKLDQLLCMSLILTVSQSDLSIPCYQTLADSITTPKSYQTCLLNAQQVDSVHVLNIMLIYKPLQRISDVHYLKCFGQQLLSNGSVIRSPTSWAPFLYIWVPFFVGLFSFLLFGAVPMSKQWHRSLWPADDSN